MAREMTPEAVATEAEKRKLKEEKRRLKKEQKEQRKEAESNSIKKFNLWHDGKISKLRFGRVKDEWGTNGTLWI